MLTKSKIKFIKSLHIKKYRSREGKFLVEGEKSVAEVLSSGYKIHFIVATKKFIYKYNELLTDLELYDVTEDQVSSLSTFKSNNTVLAVVFQKTVKNPEFRGRGWQLALDDIRDPGNMGTIVRIADWYGVDTIIASLESAEVYNPKVISASMGSFTRVNVQYEDLGQFLSNQNQNVYGASLTGGNIYKFKAPQNGILLMGNESRGINDKYRPFLSGELMIPSFGGAESLNVAVSTGILLDNIIRKINK